MRLAQYLKRQAISGSAFARALGVSKASVSFWVRGLELPNRRNAFKIERATAGAVPAASWGEPPTPSRPAHRKSRRKMGSKIPEAA